MEMDYTHSYPADPKRVVELIRDPEFLADIARHAGAVDHDVATDGEETALRMKVPVPGNLTKFIGESMRMHQVFRFAAPHDDGSIDGTVDVEVPGFPVDVRAAVRLLPADDATTGRYTGTLKVKLPLIGKKVEAQIEPFVRGAFDGLQRRADAWLTR